MDGGLALAKLCADARGEIGAVYRKRDDVVGAQIQGVSAVGGSAGDDQHDSEDAIIRAGLERRNESGAVEIVGAGFRNEHFRGERENLIDGQPDFGRGVVALARERVIGLEKRFGG